MPIRLVQTTPDFPKLGQSTFAIGDSIVFTHGLVEGHGHGRDNNQKLGDGMSDILTHTVRQFALALKMPNLEGQDALLTPQKAIAYYERAMAASEGKVKLVVTVYLNKGLTEDDIKLIAEDERIAGIKHYPGHATTNSEHGMRTPLEATKQLEWMQKYNVPLLVHGQVRTNERGDVMDEWDREPFFYYEEAPVLDQRYPGLRISYEHLSTGVGANTVVARKGPTQGTFTIIHLGKTRTDVMDTGVDTRMVMKPMIQHAREQAKLWSAFRARPDRFGLGSDDAWHPMYPAPGLAAKHATNCACGGCYGPYRVGFYLDVFEKMGALDLFGRFACVNVARFYGLEVPKKTVTMRKGPYTVAKMLPYGNHVAEPLHSGEELVGWHQVYDA